MIRSRRDAVAGTSVVIGSGSAGRRHALALRGAMPNAAVTVVRRPDSLQPIDDLQAARVNIVTSIDQIDGTIELGVVASPATMHALGVEELATRGTASVMVEKPLAASLDDAERLQRVANAAKVQVSVGYHLRYFDTVRRLRTLVERGVIGVPCEFDFCAGQHLSSWRPGMDATRSVSARVELGGGVLNELSHELDAVRYLLGDVATVSARLAYTGAPTDGAVETVADLRLALVDGLNGSVHLDMVSEPSCRRWSIRGDEATIRADLLSGRIECDRPRDTEVLVERERPGGRERAEERLIANLIAMADSGEVPECGMEDGIAVVRIIEAARRSAREGGAEEHLTPGAISSPERGPHP